MAGFGNEQAMTDKAKQKQAVLDRLKAGPATTMQLISLGMCCPTRRIFELRQAGYDIRTSEQWRGRTRIVTYTLLGQCELPLEAA